MLTERARHLGHSIDRWNIAMICSLAFAALAAVAVGVTTRFVAVRSKEFADVQEAIIKAKDEQLSTELKEKDVRIAEASERSSKAEEGTAIARANAAEANRRAAEANRIAEQERVERLSLEAQIAPRRLFLEQSESIQKEFSRFHGRSVSVVSYAFDAEGAVLAKQLIAALRGAGLQVDDSVASISPLGGFSLGVHVNGSSPEMVEGIGHILSSTGGLLVAPANLKPANQWEMRVGSSLTAEVTILVGVKPVI